MKEVEIGLDRGASNRPSRSVPFHCQELEQTMKAQHARVLSDVKPTQQDLLRFNLNFIFPPPFTSFILLQPSLASIHIN